MSFPLGLAEGDKFAILAVENAGTTVSAPGVLSDGTAVATGIPAEMIDEFWQTSLGTIAVQGLHRCNLLFCRKRASAKPAVLDSEHEELGKRLTELFWLLQLSGVPYYESASVLKGSVLDGVINVRAHTNLSEHQFLPSTDAANTHVTMDRLNRAAEQAVTWRELLSLPEEYARFKRGLNVLLEGLQERFGQERLHAFVRALEALILPEKGKTTKQFIDRGQTFSAVSPAAAAVLRECFDMRSVVEHMNDPHECLSSYPAEQREPIALRRVRQVETLARFSYMKLLANKPLLHHFRSDAKLGGFWNLPLAERKALWGSQLNLESVV